MWSVWQAFQHRPASSVWYVRLFVRPGMILVSCAIYRSGAGWVVLKVFFNNSRNTVVCVEISVYGFRESLK